MRLGTLVPLQDIAKMHALAEQGFGFVEIIPPTSLAPLPPLDQLPPLPMIWQCPPTLPAEHPDSHLQAAVLASWQAHLAAAQGVKAALVVVQFRRPEVLENKSALIEQYHALLNPLTAAGRAQGIQVVLRNSPDNRDQLQLLREIVRGVPGLGIALDMAYAHQQVVKNLTPEYLWDSDLGSRIAHVYACDTDGKNPQLRLPLGVLGAVAPDWGRLIRALKERYNASVTLDCGTATPEYLTLSRAKWLEWWK